jgi:hypothetical protein
MPFWDWSIASASPFAYPHIYVKNMYPEAWSFSRNRVTPHPQSSFKGSDWSCSSRRSGGFWGLLHHHCHHTNNHVLTPHHYMWVVICRHMRWMGIGWDWSCNHPYVSTFEVFVLRIFLCEYWYTFAMFNACC